MSNRFSKFFWVSDLFWWSALRKIWNPRPLSTQKGLHFLPHFIKSHNKSSNTVLCQLLSPVLFLPPARYQVSNMFSSALSLCRRKCPISCSTLYEKQSIRPYIRGKIVLFIHTCVDRLLKRIFCLSEFDLSNRRFRTTEWSCLRNAELFFMDFTKG